MQMNDKSVGIIGIGSYVPEKVVTNFDLEKIVDTSDTWIYERTGIRQRHVCAEDQATSDLGLEAAKRALADAKVSPEELDLIILATVSPDTMFPAVACRVQDALGAKNAAAFDLSAACSGFAYAMTVGAQFIKTGMYKKVLVVASEALSKITNWEDRNTCVLFGDGAGAVILGEVEEGYGIIEVELGSEGAGANLLHMPAGGSRRPATPETVAEKLHSIHMNGNEVFKFAVKTMGESAVRAIKKAGLTTDDISLLVPHQANMRIIKSAAKRLGFPMDKVFVNVDKYANTSSASIPLALDEAVKSGCIKKGDTFVIVGFGAGLTWASAVIKWYKED